MSIIYRTIDRSRHQVRTALLGQPTKHLRRAVTLRVRAGAEPWLAFEQVKGDVLHFLPPDYPWRKAISNARGIKDIAQYLDD